MQSEWESKASEQTCFWVESREQGEWVTNEFRTKHVWEAKSVAGLGPSTGEHPDKGKLIVSYGRSVQRVYESQPYRLASSSRRAPFI